MGWQDSLTKTGKPAGKIVLIGPACVKPEWCDTSGQRSVLVYKVRWCFDFLKRFHHIADFCRRCDFWSMSVRIPYRKSASLASSSKRFRLARFTRKDHDDTVAFTIFTDTVVSERSYHHPAPWQPCHAVALSNLDRSGSCPRVGASIFSPRLVSLRLPWRTLVSLLMAFSRWSVRSLIAGSICFQPYVPPRHGSWRTLKPTMMASVGVGEGHITFGDEPALRLWWITFTTISSVPSFGSESRKGLTGTVHVVTFDDCGRVFKSYPMRGRRPISSSVSVFLRAHTLFWRICPRL